MKIETNNLIAKTGLLATATFLLGIVTLWAWNTLATLVGVPEAQFKHIVAAALLAVIARWFILGSAASGECQRFSRKGGNQ